MGRHIHKLTNVNLTARTATCSACGQTRIKFCGNADGKKKYRCIVAARPWRRGSGKGGYIGMRGTICGRCGFVPEHMCQLDVDHMDSNHSNNDPSNIQTLCVNCHRFVTYQRWANG